MFTKKKIIESGDLLATLCVCTSQQLDKCTRATATTAQAQARAHLHTQNHLLFENTHNARNFERTNKIVYGNGLMFHSSHKCGNLLVRRTVTILFASAIAKQSRTHTLTYYVVQGQGCQSVSECVEHGRQLLYV